jgi:hypothetical protein
MSRRAIVVLSLLAVLAMAAGVAAGIVFAHRGAKPVAAEQAVTPPAATVPDSTAPASPTSTATGPSTTTSTGAATLTLRARVAQRLEDGLLVRWDASAPVDAVLTWGFGTPAGHQLQLPGGTDHGTAKLPLPTTTQPVTFRVAGTTADGRSASSAPASGRRLVRRVTLRVASLTLDIPAGTGGVSTSFLGTTYTFGPGLKGPTAAAQPYAFPAKPLTIGTDSDPLALEFFHQPPSGALRTGQTSVGVDFPEPGRTITLQRDASAVGVTAHLQLRVTVTIS